MVLVLLAQAATGGEASAVDSAGNRVDWRARPAARELAACVSGSLPTSDLLLVCKTAPKDRLTDCAAAPEAPPPEARALKFGLCVARKFEVRAVTPEGHAVTGTEVRVPIRTRTRP